MRLMRAVAACGFVLALAAPAAAQKISEFPAAAALTGPELTLVVQGGVTSQSTASAILPMPGTLTNKSINCASNTCTVRLGLDVTGTLPLGHGGTGATTAAAAIANLGLGTINTPVFYALSLGGGLYNGVNILQANSPNGQVAIASSTYASDNTSGDAGSVIRDYMWAFNNHPSSSKTVWNQYLETHLTKQAVSVQTFGVENAMYTRGTPVSADPYSDNVSGATENYRLACGIGASLPGDITASSSGTTLTITAVNSGSVYNGQVVTGAGIAADTELVRQLTGNPQTAIGTWETSVSNTVSSETMTLELDAKECTSALHVLYNGSTFKSGLIFGSTSLTADGDGLASPLQLPKNYSIDWFSAAGNKAWRIYSSATSGNQTIELSNVGVGIGATPLDKLHVSQSVNSAVGAVIENTNAGADAETYLQLGNNLDSNAGIVRSATTNSGDAALAGAGSLNLYNSGPYDIGFATNNTLRMTIDGTTGAIATTAPISATGTTAGTNAAAGIVGETLSTAGGAANGTVTITIASPAVISDAGACASGIYNLCVSPGSVVNFTTTDTLPTGIVAGTNYYVLSTGFVAGASYRISTTAFGTAVDTSGSQAGVHTRVNKAIAVNNTPVDGAAVALTAGDWDCRAKSTFVTTGTTTGELSWIGPTTNSATGLLSMSAISSNSIASAGGSAQLPNGTVQINLASPTTYYLIGDLLFSAGDGSFTGMMQCRRMR